MTKATMANSGGGVAAPGGDEIDGALLLQRRPAPANSGDALLSLLRDWGGMVLGERGVEWCEEFEWGRPLFIVATVRPNGMGGRRWRHGYGLLEAWPAVAIA